MKKMVEHESRQRVKSTKTNNSLKPLTQKSPKKKNSSRKAFSKTKKLKIVEDSQVSWPSHINLVPDSYASSSDCEGEEKCCCVCEKWTPSELNQSVSLVIVKWVQCDNCKHWVHLQFCTPIRVVRRGDTFLCPHCTIDC